ncbi:hypothetical protein CDAR_408501 [Caerostris darwini]|uniref:Uncharacterized protein n=1 Tax=Caerostris darwini TaxID=1538125 RepID=A0AAV4X2U6_9ARAC|nr:hypothetical protein CDAR_408501 [Caerostris darwini]
MHCPEKQTEPVFCCSKTQGSLLQTGDDLLSLKCMVSSSSRVNALVTHQALPHLSWETKLKCHLSEKSHAVTFNLVFNVPRHYLLQLEMPIPFNTCSVPQSLRAFFSLQ